MTQQEYENKIKELEKQIEELKMAKVEEPQSKRWKPKDELYWGVDYNGFIFKNNGFIFKNSCGNDSVDNWCYLTGNCFKTEDEAKEYKKQIEYTARYKNYIEEHSEPIDWNNFEQNKWFAYYESMDGKIVVGRVISLLAQGTIHASSKQIIEDAINEIGEDNFKKYVLGVK